MTVWTPVRLAALALAALFSSGCAIHMTHRCDVPTPVVEAAPGARKLPLAVVVRTVPRTTLSETFEQRDEHHRWGVDPLPPTRTMLERLAASVFDRVVADPASAGTTATSSADALVELRVEGVRFAWDPIGFGPYTASVSYRAAVVAPGGTPVAELDLSGEGSRGPVYTPATHCKGIGDAVALAMQDAGSKLLAWVESDPAIAAWLGARGIAAPVLAVRPPGAYPPREDEDGGAARPVTAPPAKGPQAPRSMQLRVGVGAFRGDSTAGALENPSTGFAFTIMGVEVRPRPELGVTLEFGSIGRGYSGKVLTPPSPLAVPRGIFLGTMLFGAGVRGVLPGGPVEPWVGATALALRNELSATYSLLGFPGTGSPEEVAWSAGLDLGAGLLLYPGKRVQLGIEVRRILSRASFDAFPGTVSVGGWTTSVSFGGVAP